MNIQLNLSSSAMTYDQIKENPGAYHVNDSGHDFCLISLSDGTILYINDLGSLNVAKESHWSHRTFERMTGTIKIEF